ncbi:leucine-rich repeat domain-containing protein [Marinibactrum halimedae]|nr:leucine-rich repeat domain-containing protein [Marinibactrum halimedae]MCD9460165.1 leucine-rich repeat domain-containing protein [Marinibactrum halimedae]
MMMLILMVLFNLTGCEGYQWQVNDRAVYTPPSTLIDIQATDFALRACIDQTIKDQNITSANQLTTLICTNAGIVSIEGLNQFNQLEQVNLANNTISSVSGLIGMSAIVKLSLENNDIKEIQPLLGLMKLTSLNLAGNSALPCEGVAQLSAQVSSVYAPEHCTRH